MKEKRSDFARLFLPLMLAAGCSFSPVNNVVEENSDETREMHPTENIIISTPDSFGDSILTIGQMETFLLESSEPSSRDIAQLPDFNPPLPSESLRFLQTTREFIEHINPLLNFQDDRYDKRLRSITSRVTDLRDDVVLPQFDQWNLEKVTGQVFNIEGVEFGLTAENYLYYTNEREDLELRIYTVAARRSFYGNTVCLLNDNDRLYGEKVNQFFEEGTLLILLHQRKNSYGQEMQHFALFELGDGKYFAVHPFDCYENCIQFTPEQTSTVEPTLTATPLQFTPTPSRTSEPTVAPSRTPESTVVPSRTPEPTPTLLPPTPTDAPTQPPQPTITLDSIGSTPAVPTPEPTSAPIEEVNPIVPVFDDNKPEPTSIFD